MSILTPALLGYLIHRKEFQQWRVEEGQDSARGVARTEEEDPQLQKVLQVPEMGNNSNHTFFMQWCYCTMLTRKITTNCGKFFKRWEYQTT